VGKSVQKRKRSLGVSGAKPDFVEDGKRVFEVEVGSVRKPESGEAFFLVVCFFGIF
jgi:hypothetical protein